MCAALSKASKTKTVLFWNEKRLFYLAIFRGDYINGFYKHINIVFFFFCTYACPDAFPLFFSSLYFVRQWNWNKNKQKNKFLRVSDKKWKWNDIKVVFEWERIQFSCVAFVFATVRERKTENKLTEICHENSAWLQHNNSPNAVCDFHIIMKITRWNNDVTHTRSPRTSSSNSKRCNKSSTGFPPEPFPFSAKGVNM